MPAAVFRQDVLVQVGEASLEGTPTAPPDAAAIVLFAHGSGSSRFSPRNRKVAGTLHDAGLATLLMDLLTPDEQQADEWSGHLRFDIELLADRVSGAIDWLDRDASTAAMRLGLFGASTGAAGALMAAAHYPVRVRAVVSRGGRPDLAGEFLSQVNAPVLLIVGGNDQTVLELNRKAQLDLRCQNRLEIIPGAAHLFEEPGKLDRVAQLAAQWFVKYL